MPWLQLGIMSHGRNGDPDYLLRVLYAIDEDMPAARHDPIRAGVEVVVVNNQEPVRLHPSMNPASLNAAVHPIGVAIGA